MSGNWFILMKLFIIKVIGETQNSETRFMKDAGIWSYTVEQSFRIIFIHFSIFSCVTGCNWNASSLSWNESISLVNYFLLIDFRETSLATVLLKYLSSLFVSTFNVLSFGFRILCAAFHIFLLFLEYIFFVEGCCCFFDFWF